MTTENQGNPPPLSAEEKRKARLLVAFDLTNESNAARIYAALVAAEEAGWRAGHLAGQRAGLDAVVNLCGDWCAEEGCPCEPASIARAIRRLPLAEPPPYEGKESKNG